MANKESKCGGMVSMAPSFVSTDDNLVTRQFRPIPGYRGEFFVVITIPANEDVNVVPCGAKRNADGSYRFVFNLLYVLGDLCYARSNAERVLAEYPTWDAGIYRASTGCLVGGVR